MPEIASLIPIACPICGSNDISIGSIVKLVPYEGSLTRSYPISIGVDNRVVIDDTPLPVHDFVGQRLAVAFICHENDHTWNVILVEHQGQCYTMNPITSSDCGDDDEDQEEEEGEDGSNGGLFLP